jgi:hypothetical protein
MNWLLNNKLTKDSIKFIEREPVTNQRKPAKIFFNYGMYMTYLVSLP